MRVISMRRGCRNRITSLSTLCLLRICSSLSSSSPRKQNQEGIVGTNSVISSLRSAI